MLLPSPPALLRHAQAAIPRRWPEALTRDFASRKPEQFARDAGFARIAGVDEAGRGPWAGPVVAAAVILRDRRRRLPVRIDDSKRLTALQRTRAFAHILHHADVGVGIVSAEEIDRRSILAATLAAMQHAVHELSPAPDLVLVDGLTAPPLEMPAWPIVHGDARSYPIACASIVAKVLRDSLMAFYHRLLPAYQFDRHKGYGTAVHARVLHERGPSWLHRMSVQPVAEAPHVG